LTNALGNRLAGYFYFTNTAECSDKKLAKECRCNAKAKNLELKNFYNKLNCKRQNKIIDYKSEPESSWHSLNDDGSQKLNYLKFWQTIRPEIQEIYQKNIKKSAMLYPVVHFRCSDTPFMKHLHYHLTKTSTVVWMIEKIKERGFSKIILLNCSGHRNSANNCTTYVDFYIDLFKSHDLEVELQCNSIFEDFTLMFYSPLLVSLNTSSFSFMAGIAKDPQDYISCNMGLEIDGQYFLQTQADWILDSSVPLLHKDVKDYNNSSDVIEKLQK
jgi:hypothetical protein